MYEQKQIGSNSSYGQMQQARTNRFGEMEVLKTAIAVVDKKTGDTLPIFKTYFETAGQLYKIEISHRRKETKTGLPGMWVKITKKAKRSQNQAQRF